jgi:hypothetical protein
VSAVDAASAYLDRLRSEYPSARSEAWAALLLAHLSRYAERGPDEMQEVAAIAGITTRPKMVTQNGRLRKVTTEQVLVTPRAREQRYDAERRRAG